MSPGRRRPRPHVWTPSPGVRPCCSGWSPQLLAEPDVLLLDEPTNNLDAVARGRLYEVVAQFSGTVIVGQPRP